MSKPFFFRITSADLIDFATDPDGEKMTLLQFAKELQKGKSDVAFIQHVIDETHNYIEKKRISGSKGGSAKRSDAKAKDSDAKANPSAPLARSSNSSSSITEKEKTKRFVPPSQAEVETYISENHLDVDSVKWINHYTSNGWKVGKNKMVDWKAAIRTWAPKKLELVPQTTKPLYGTPEYKAELQKKLAL